MSRRPVQAAVCALWWAFSGCSTGGQDARAKAESQGLAYGIAHPTAQLPPPRPRDDVFLRGVSLELFAGRQDDELRKPLYTRLLNEINALGATDLELVVRWSQPDASAIEIAPHSTETVDDELLKWLMDQANKRNLRVFLLPVLEVEAHAQDAGRSALAPADWERWWWSYRRFIMHYARIAEGHKAALFSVGSELRSAEPQGEQWRQLIELVRKAYTGKITYSANWDHFESVSFWDAIDVVGITAYHELSSKVAPSDEELTQGSRSFARRLRAWALAKNKRYIFTEVGYPSQPHAASRPWDRRELGAADPLLQLRCYRSLFRAFQDDPRLDGLFVGNWSGEGGSTGTSYTPRGKPAAEVLKHWFRASRT